MNLTEKITDNNTNIPLIFDGYVVNVDDNNGTGQIRVRIDNVDSNVENDELPICLPLLPLNINIKPKIGERVRVMFSNITETSLKSRQSIRFYISSYSSYKNLSNDPYHYTANSNQPDGFTVDTEPINNKPESLGLYPSNDEVALLGKNNSDIILKDSEVLIRAGKESGDLSNRFNQFDPSYIQLKHGVPELIEETITQTVTKQIVIPAEYEIKINLSNNIYTLNVLNINDASTVITETRNNLTDIKTLYNNVISTYDRYVLTTDIDDLQYLPTTFKDNVQTVTETVTKTVRKNSNTDTGSVANIVADKINLLTHNAPLDLDVTNQPDYITVSGQSYINTNAYSLVIGEILNDFLEDVKTYIQTHTHPYHNTPPTKTILENRITGFNLEDLLTKNIKING